MTNSTEKQVLQILEQVIKKEGQKINYPLLDVFLFYFPDRAYPTKAKEQIEEKKEESTLEVDLKETVEMAVKEDDDFLSVRYLPLENRLIPGFAYNGKAAPDGFYSGIASLLPEDEEYESPRPANDNYETEPSINEEARGGLLESKYDFIVSPLDVDCEQKQKLAIWIQFNPTLFSFLELFYGLSRDVDYKAAV